jgi:hypothetical protein
MKDLRILLPLLILFCASLLFAQDAEHRKWPAALVDQDMPVFTGGKFKGWNQWDKSNEYSLFMIIEETNQAELDKYITQLKAAGFEQIDEATFRKDLFEVKVQFNSKTILQISSHRINTMVWPGKLLTGVPEPKGGALTQVDEPSEEMPGYVHMYIINFKREKVDAWLQDLKKAGFIVEEDGASKPNMTLAGKTYKSLSIQLQENGSGEWIVDFNYSD